MNSTYSYRIILIFILNLIIITPSLSDLNDTASLITNNTSYSPDLSLSKLLVIQNGGPGEKLSGSLIVENKGPVSASSVKTDFWLFKSETKDQICIWLGSKSTPTLESGMKGKVPFLFTIPQGIIPGYYFLESTISETEKELFTNDNTIKTEEPILLTNGKPWKGENPNLITTINSAEPNVTSSGSPFYITFTIQNTNNESAGTAHTGFFLTKDKNISSDDYLIHEEITYKIYGSMMEKIKSVDLLPENIPEGRYYLVAVTDYTGQIQESHEDDNIFFYPDSISITYPLNLNSIEYSNQISGLLFLKTNKYRSYLGLQTLQYDSSLSSLSNEHTLDMIKRNYFSHYTPEGLDPEGRAKLAGYETSKQMSDGTMRTGIAENIIRIASGHTIGKAYSGFIDPTTPEEIADIMMIEWINSPEHNKNLINPDIEKIGIGTRYNGEYFYATQNFY